MKDFTGILTFFTKGDGSERVRGFVSVKVGNGSRVFENEACFLFF